MIRINKTMIYTYHQKVRCHPPNDISNLCMVYDSIGTVQYTSAHELSTVLLVVAWPPWKVVSTAVIFPVNMMTRDGVKLCFENVHFIPNISECVCVAGSDVIEPIYNNFIGSKNLYIVAVVAK